MERIVDITGEDIICAAFEKAVRNGWQKGKRVEYDNAWQIDQHWVVKYYVNDKSLTTGVRDLFYDFSFANALFGSEPKHMIQMDGVTSYGLPNWEYCLMNMAVDHRLLNYVRNAAQLL